MGCFVGCLYSSTVSWRPFKPARGSGDRAEATSKQFGSLCDWRMGKPRRSLIGNSLTVLQSNSCLSDIMHITDTHQDSVHSTHLLQSSYISARAVSILTSRGMAAQLLQDDQAICLRTQATTNNSTPSLQHLHLMQHTQCSRMSPEMKDKTGKLQVLPLLSILNGR